MAKLEELVIELAAETKQLQAALKTSVSLTESSTKAMEKAVSAFSENSTQKTSVFQTAMGTMAGFIGGAVVIGAFNLVKDAALGMANAILGDGIAAANAQEEALARLNNALNLTGQGGQKAIESFGEFADEMEKLKNINDDVVLAQAATLASMTRLSNDGIKDAIGAAADLSAAMGIGLEQAVTLVGKAANGQTDAFKKMGIEISEAGSKGDVFARTLETINGRFGGAAAAKAETFAGSITKLQNSFGNFVEELATTITTNNVVIDVLSELGKIFGELQAGVSANKNEIKDFIGTAVIVAIESIKLLVEITEGLVRTLRGAVSAIIGVGQAFVDTFQAAKALVSGEGLEGVKAAFAETGAAFSTMSDAFTEDTAFDTIEAKLSGLSDTAATSLGEMNAGLERTPPAAKKAAAAIVELDETTKAFRESQAEFAKGLADQGMTFQNVYQNQTEAAKTFFDSQIVNQADSLTATQDYYASLQEIQLAQFEAEQTALDEARANQLITEQQYAAAKTELAFQQSEAEKKLGIEKQKAITEQNKKKVQDLQSTFSTIATLSESSNKELAAIGKAAAIANATIDGIAAVQKALASAPPPFNFALAALVGAATAANVAKISGTPLAGGIDSVPRSSLGGNNGDNFPAVLQPGERVVPAETNKDLTEFLARGQGAQNIQVSITIQNNVPASREAGAQMVEAINDYFAAGGLRFINT